MHSNYSASTNAIAAGLMAPNKPDDEPLITPLGIFVLKGQLAHSAADNHEVEVTEFRHLLDAATSGGFKCSGELLALFAAGVCPMQSPRFLQLCQQAVAAICK